MRRTAEIRAFRYLLRKSKYGEEIAARYSPGSTPERISSEYVRRQAELTRQYEQELEASDMSDDGEWEKEEVLRRTREAPGVRATAEPSRKKVTNLGLETEGHERRDERKAARTEARKQEMTENSTEGWVIDTDREGDRIFGCGRGKDGCFSGIPAMPSRHAALVL